MAINDDIEITEGIAQRRVDYIGGFGADNKPTNVYSSAEVYAYVQEYIARPEQSDNAPAIKSETNISFSWINKWHGTRRLHKAMFGGGWQTTNQARQSGTENGVIQIPYSVGGGSQFVDSDRGLPCTHTDGDDGIFLDFDTERSVCWIRPDDETAGHDWDSLSGTIAVTGGTGSVTQDNSSITGETTYANIFTVSTRLADTEVYLKQINEFSEVTSPTEQKLYAWWDSDSLFVDSYGYGGVPANQIDVLVPVIDMNAVVDGGLVVAMIHPYGRQLATFPVVAPAGGRTVAALLSGLDGNITTGYRHNIATTTSGTLVVGEVVTGGTSGAKGVVTLISGTNPNQIFDYSIYTKVDSAGDEVDFSGAEALSAPGGYAATSGTLSNVGPAADTNIVLTWGSNAVDVDQNDTDEQYAGTVDFNSVHTKEEVAERTKYLIRHGNTGDIDAGAQTIEGDHFQGITTLFFDYDAEGGSGSPLEGEAVVKNGDASVTGTVAALYDAGTTGFVFLRDVRGTWADNDVCEAVAAAARSVTIFGDPEEIAEVAANPICNLAGDLIEFRRGWVPINVPAADASKFTVVTMDGVSVAPPSFVTCEINGVVTTLNAEDTLLLAKVASGEAAGSFIYERDTFTCTAAGGGQNTIGDEQLEIDIAIPQETAGKTTGLTVRAVDTSLGFEHRYRVDTWSGQIFTLAGVGVNAGSATSTDATGVTLTDTSGGFTSTDDVERGDLILNETTGDIFSVIAVVSGTVLTTVEVQGAGNGWTSTDTYTINKLVVTYTTGDNVWTPIIDKVAAAAAENTTLVYPGGDIDCTYTVLNSTSPNKIFPESGPAVVTTTGVTITARRDADPVA